MNPQIQAELEDARKSAEVTQEMIEAGVEVLSGWKYDMEFVSERQAVEEIYRAMAAIQAIKA
jgi:hypothetical protein